MILGELAVKLGFKGAIDMLKDLDTLKNKTLKFSNTLSEAVKKLNDMTAAAREHAYTMEVYEKTTGKSAEQLQNLSYQAAQFNITQEELAGTLRNIQQISTDVRLGRGMPSAFTLFGIDPNQDPTQILAQVQQGINNLDAPTALNIASELGIDEKMFYMLKMTSKGMESLNKQYRITAQERANLIKLNAEWQKFWFLLKQIQTKFQAATADLQAEAIRRFLEIANRIADMATGFLKAVEASSQLKVAVIALGVALTAVFTPWLATLGAVFLILEDIWTYFEGGDSITGEIVEWIKDMGIFGENLEGVKALLDIIKKSLTWIVQKTEAAGRALARLKGKSQDAIMAEQIAEEGKQRQWLFDNDREAYMQQYGSKVNNNTINNTFYSNEAPTREDIAGASSDAIYQLEAAS